MKKFFTILLALIYLAVSSGLAMEIHHCMDKVADITLIPTGSKKCDNCGMPKAPNNCCKNELKILKLTDSYKLVHADYRLAVPEVVLPSQFFTSPARTHMVSMLTDTVQIPQSPGSVTRSLLLLHGVFRI